MASGSSFFDLLKEELRKKKSAAVQIPRKDAILKSVKTFIKHLINLDISKTIETIKIIRNDLEKGECPEEFDLTLADFDLILFINAVLLCCGHKWEEAEELLYQLTEKHQESLFFALLGIVKNKRHIFRCSRDAFCLAQITSHKPKIFENLNLSITNLKEITLKGSITKLLGYTKNMEEIPLNNYINTKNIFEINYDKTIGDIFRYDIFPIIRDQIDIFLCGKLPNNSINPVISNDMSTQTINVTHNKGFQTDLIKTINKSVQTLKFNDKNEQKKGKELMALKTTIEELRKTNSDLTKRLNEAALSHSAAQNKIRHLSDELQELRQNYIDNETTMLEIIRCAFTSLYHFQKIIGDQRREKLQRIEAMLTALRSELIHLGLKRDVDHLSCTITQSQNETQRSNKSIDEKQKRILRLLDCNQFTEILSLCYEGYILEPNLIEQPNLIDLVAKLISICRNNKLINQNMNSLQNEASGGGYYLNDFLPPSFRNRTKSNNRMEKSEENPNETINQRRESWVENVDPYVEPSNPDFPPLGGLSRRRWKKINARDEFDTYIAKIQSLLPLCTIAQIKGAIQALQSQRNINLKEIKVKDVVEYLKSKYKSSIIDDATNNVLSVWEYNNLNSQSDENTDTEKSACPICLDPIDQCQMTLSCGHLFHNNCITEWLRSKGSCPICRVNIYYN